MKRLSRASALTLAIAGLLTGASAGAAQGATWHLDSSFGNKGVAGLPLREEGVDSMYEPGPGDTGPLLAAGPQESLFVGGYADRKPGAFLVAQMSARGRLVKGFGDGGVSVVPSIYSTPQKPPRLFALAGGKLLIVGQDRAGQLAVVMLTARGQADRGFGHDGVASYTLEGSNGHALLAATTIEADGDILVAYYHSEVPQPVNEPRIQPGLGRGPLELVRLTRSGAIDRTFGSAGFLLTSGQPPATGEGVACNVVIDSDGSVLLAYEQAASPGGTTDGPALQELGPSGVDDAGFGEQGVAFLPSLPTLEGESSLLCSALYALPDGAVEASFGGAGELYRFTPAGAPDPSFGTSGHTSSGAVVRALALAADGETFALRSGRTLTVAGTLASGKPDPALGGGAGERFPARLPPQRDNEEQQAVELLAAGHSVSVLAGEEILRIEA